MMAVKECWMLSASRIFKIAYSQDLRFAEAILLSDVNSGLTLVI